jgi:hypothetical protein
MSGVMFSVRVMVTPVWDQVSLPVDQGTSVGEIKKRALTEATGRQDLVLPDYVVKYRGAEVLDESQTLAALGAGANAPFIVLPARRQPVR